MIIRRISGILDSNCYIAGNNGEAVVIDPGVDAGEILLALHADGLKPKYIILTHTHFDHISSLDELRKLTGAQAAVHSEDASALSDSNRNLSWMIGMKLSLKPAEILLKDGDTLEAGGITFDIIHTPGHTPGGICIKTGGNLFTGDTLFKLSKGRTDFFNGDEDALDSSLKRLMGLDTSTIVYPGHGPATTIGYERNYNPYCVFG